MNLRALWASLRTWYAGHSTRDRRILLGLVTVAALAGVGALVAAFLAADEVHRDEVARAINSEVKAGRGSPHGGVFLDIAWIKEKLPHAAEHIKKKLPSMYHQFMQLAGIDGARAAVRTESETSQRTTTSGRSGRRVRNWGTMGTPPHGRLRRRVRRTGGTVAAPGRGRSRAERTGVRRIRACFRSGPGIRWCGGYRSAERSSIPRARGTAERRRCRSG